MNYYFLLLFVSFVIGQLLYFAVGSYVYQKKNINIDYLTAIKVYAKGEIGGFIIAFLVMLLVAFVLPAFFDLTKTHADLLAKKDKVGLTKFENYQLMYRAYCAFFGLFVQLIFDKAFKIGKKAIDNYGANT